MPSITSDFDTKAKINDNLSFSPLPITIEQNTYAWAAVPNTQFVIWEYNITNTHATDTIKNMYASILNSGYWLVEHLDKTEVLTMQEQKWVIAITPATGGKYGGIKLLTNTAPPNFYAVDHVSGGNGGIDFANGVDTKDKYLTLSTQRSAAGLNGNGNDVINVMSSGPFKLGPNESVTVAFALVGGDSLPNLVSGAQQAQIKYDGMVTKVNESKSSNYNGKFPNPTKDALPFHKQKQPLISMRFTISTEN